jgi:phosphoserine phosphatase RsbX
MVEWGIAAVPRHPHDIPGDLGLVVSVPAGVLVGAVDGLGHGREAARAAQIAGGLIRADGGHDLVGLIRRCHQALRHNRGAAVSLALLSPTSSRLTWAGVGTVEGTLLNSGSPWGGPRAALPLGRGVAGLKLPPLHAATVDLRRGDVLVLATDGVDRAFAAGLHVSGTPQTLADRVLAEHRNGSDDALVVVVRYMGKDA